MRRQTDRFAIYCVAQSASRRLDRPYRKLPGAAILLNIKCDLLALDQPTHSGALERGGVNENVIAAVIRLDEAEAFLIIIKLNGTCIHCKRPFADLRAAKTQPHDVCAELDVSMFGGSERTPAQSTKAKRPDCPAKCRS
jgi:hypothetical protein